MGCKVLQEGYGSFYRHIYLNYVGCKDRLYTSGKIIMFYLNYVGCTLIENDFRHNNLKFYLTMWDVTKYLYSYRKFRSRFYLNYVGCKLFSALFILKVFTLTMGCKGLLTKLNKYAIMFYLNYVGCKVIHSSVNH